MEREAAADDVRFGEIDERRVYTELRAFDPGACRDGGERFERLDECRTAVGVTRVVERIDAQDDIGCIEDLGPAERERQKDGVARRYIRGRDAVGGDLAVARDRIVR